MTNQLSKIIPLGVTAATIASNYLFPQILGKSVGQVSEDNELLVTPSGWTFSIWGIIYSGLSYLGYKYYKGEFEWSNESLVLFTASGFFNGYWIYNWLQGKTVISQYLLYGLSLSLLLLWYDNLGKQKTKIYQNIIAMYAAWTIGASILNTAINVKKDPNNKLSDIQIANYVIFGIVGVQIIWQVIQEYEKKRLDAKKDSILLPIVGIWTGLGIITNKKDYDITYKSLPLIVSGLTTKYHLEQIGIKTNNPLKIVNELYNFLYR